MIPREPDRFDKIARDIFAQWERTRNAYPRDIAAALRQAADEALERAAHRLEEIARDYDGRKLRSMAMDEPVEAAIAAEMARAAWRCVKAVYEMKSPAAAPAAEPCPEPPPGLVETLEKVHGMGCGNIATHRIPAPPSAGAPSLLPRVLAALVRQAEFLEGGNEYLGSMPLRALAAELRRYIGEMEGKT